MWTINDPAPWEHSGIRGRTLVFIVGSPRSGTTWLQCILSQSSHVATAPETHLFSRYLRSALDTWPAWRGFTVGLSNTVSEEEFYDWLRCFSASCFNQIAKKRPEANILIEKTPSHVFCASEILRFFPESYFIHLIRDPRAVVNSLRAASRSFGRNWAPQSVEDASRVWTKHVSAGEAITKLTSRYAQVRYEDIHSDGADVIAGLLSWLGVAAVTREDAADVIARNTVEELRRAAIAAQPRHEKTFRTFFRRGEVDSWRRELSGSGIAIIERLTRKQMARLGYEPVAGRRDRMVAEARLQSYRLANKLAKAARAGADRIKP